MKTFTMKEGTITKYESKNLGIEVSAFTSDKAKYSNVIVTRNGQTESVQYFSNHQEAVWCAKAIVKAFDFYAMRLAEEKSLSVG